jgi:transcriptional regulator with XRE-family HTH domain
MRSAPFKSSGSREALPANEDGELPRSASRAFGALLKSWRTARRYSQLDLALEAGVSQRHLSFLESGRAQPSREMVLQLSEVLQIPLRERNDLLLAARFAPLYQERALDSADMMAVKQALEATVRHHEPYPALAVDRQWNVVLQNGAVDRLVGLLGAPARVWQRVDPSGRRNLLLLSLHPLGLRGLVRNWQETAIVLLTRLQREVDANPANAQLHKLLSDLCALPGIPPLWRHAAWDAAPPPVLALELGTGTSSLKLFSMISRFGTALDVTADELRLELFFPQDEFTAGFLRGNKGRRRARRTVHGHGRRMGLTRRMNP